MWNLQSAQIQHHHGTLRMPRMYYATNKHIVDASLEGIYQLGLPALLVLDLHEDNRHITCYRYIMTWNTTNYSQFVLIWFVASLISMQFIWAVLIYFYTIIMTNNGLLNASPCHVDSIRYNMATNCSAPSKPILDRTRANEVATSLLSMQCVWAMVICFYISLPSVMMHWTRSIAILTALDMNWLLHAAHACQPNRTASGRLKASWHQFHQCSSSEQWQYASILSIPCRMSHQTRLIAILTTLDTKWWLNVRCCCWQ